MGIGSSGRRIVVEFVGDASALRNGVKDAEGALGGFSQKAQAAGRVAGKVLAGGLLLAGAAAVSATKAAAEDEAAQSQLAQQLRQAAGASDSQIASTEDWITAQGKATGITDDELRPALARLATATGDVGEAQRLAALAMDVSAGSGKSYQQVTEALAKAQNGNIGALGRLGIATKDAGGQTKTLTQIQQDLADKYNGAASKAADTAAGKQKILTTQFSELQEQIGANLLPVMVKLGETLLKVTGFISNHTQAVGLTVAAIGGLLAATWAIGTAMGVYAVVTGEATAVTLLQKAAVGAVAAAQLLWSGVMKAVTAGQWLMNAALTANPIGLVVIAIAALVAGLIIAYKHSETFRNIVNAAFGAVMSVVKPVITWIGDKIPAVFGAVVDAVKTYIGIWQTVITTAFHAVKAVVSTVWNATAGIITNGIEAIVNAVKGLPGKIKDLAGDFKEAGKHVINAMVDGLKNAAGIIEGIASNVWSAVKGLLNSAIDKINSMLEFTIAIPASPDIHINPPDIPHLAKGGIVRKPTLALIGEDGPEAVVPLGRNAPRGGIGFSGGSPITIHIQTLDPAAAGKAVVEALRKAERMTGRPLLVSPA